LAAALASATWHDDEVDGLLRGGLDDDLAAFVAGLDNSPAKARAEYPSRRPVDVNKEGWRLRREQLQEPCDDQRYAADDNRGDASEAPVAVLDDDALLAYDDLGPSASRPASAAVASDVGSDTSGHWPVGPSICPSSGQSKGQRGSTDERAYATEGRSVYAADVDVGSGYNNKTTKRATIANAGMARGGGASGVPISGRAWGGGGTSVARDRAQHKQKAKKRPPAWAKPPVM
jgi:hypothetical protein